MSRQQVMILGSAEGCGGCIARYGYEAVYKKLLQFITEVQ